MDGYIYVLYDGKQDICRIGKTKSKTFQRQKKQMSYNANNMIHFTFKVKNYHDAETKTLRKFKKFSLNGDWFKIRPMVILAYINENIEWVEFYPPSSEDVFNCILQRLKD